MSGQAEPAVVTIDRREWRVWVTPGMGVYHAEVRVNGEWEQAALTPELKRSLEDHIWRNRR